MKTPSPQEAAKMTNREIAENIAFRVYPDKHPLNVMALRTEIERALDAKDAALLEADKNGYERGNQEAELKWHDVVMSYIKSHGDDEALLRECYLAVNGVRFPELFEKLVARLTPSGSVSDAKDPQ